MLELLGWIGSLCFSTCALPQVIQCIRQGHAKGVSKLFMLLWFTGEICMGSYIYLSGSMKAQLAVNYVVNIISILIILKYMVKSK